MKLNCKNIKNRIIQLIAEQIDKCTDRYILSKNNFFKRH